MTGTVVRAMDLADLRSGEMTTVEIGGSSILLARIGDDVYATASLCTHAEGWLDLGELDEEAREVECPLHGGRFKLSTGEATQLPCTTALRTYAVTVREGGIWVHA